MPTENILKHATVALDAKLLGDPWPLAEYPTGMGSRQFGRKAHLFSIGDAINEQGLGSDKFSKPAGKIARCRTGRDNHIRSNNQHQDEHFKCHPQQRQFRVPVAIRHSEIPVPLNVVP